MVEILAAISGGVTFIAFAVHTLCFYYLEISNDYDRAPYSKINFELFTYYDKKLKNKDEVVRNICNKALVISSIGFASACLFTLILNIV